MKQDLFALDSANWPALLLNDQGTIRAASQGAKGVLGATVEGASFRSFWLDPLPFEQALAKWQRGSAVHGLLAVRTPNGPASFQAVVCPQQGVTAERQILLQLLPEPKAAAEAHSPHDAHAQKQKLDCALQLSRTVALDFNNALTSILGHTSLILSKMEAGHPWRSSLGEIEKSAEKAAEIAHDLAAFSRNDKETQSQPAGNLNDLLRRTVDIFRSQSPVEWSLDFELKLYAAHFDEAKLQQAITKVLENAVQALPGRGSIKVVTRNIDVEESLHDGSARLGPGSYVKVLVADDGIGITPEALPRIFEPFFTTKKNPPHRGLGLAWVYGIVTNHGGSVTVSSNPGRGTNVSLYLPAVRKFVKDRALKDDDLTGTETILMIDDEDLLLTMGQMVLSSFGYQVLTANSGAKGLELFNQHAGEIDLVITDMVMPQMSGREVVERLRQTAPDVKIICSSGFVRTAGANEDESYLQKPFTSQDLLRKVKQTLANSESAA
ncbi:MAG TPA: ATP-binding protein [Methylomirabilota bacterium]|nr:ATP-binding protein [Methylomirabilota bacterium]